MQCHGALKRPLRYIIKSIGVNNSRSNHGYRVPSTTRSHSAQDEEDLSKAAGRSYRMEAGQFDCNRQQDHELQLGAFPPRSHRSCSTVAAPRTDNACRSHSYLRRTGRAKGARAYSTASVADKEAQEVAEDADSARSTSGSVVGDTSGTGEPSNNNAMIVRRVLREYPDKHTPSFDETIRRAEARTMEGIKSGDQLKISYFNAHETSRENRLRNNFRRWEIQKQRHLSPSSDNWRMVLALLEQATPSGEERFRKTMEAVDLPADVYLTFKTSVAIAILEIMQRTGSHVQIGGSLLTTESSTGRTQECYSSMNLLGTPQQNSAALKILPQYVDVTSPMSLGKPRNMIDFSLRSPDKSYWDEQDALSELEIEELEHDLDQITTHASRNSARISTNPTIPIRSVWSEDRHRRQAASIQSPKQLFRRPEVLSRASLAIYIEDLTQPIPRLAIKNIYGSQRPKSHLGHTDLVIAELESLLTDAAVVKVTSAISLDRVLQYLTKHSKYNAFRKIFDSLEHNGYEFSPSNWNALLAAAAKGGDVFNFRYIIRLMMDREVPLTPMTWALFHDLMCRRFPLEAGVVVEAMRKKGLLVDNKAAGQVAANSAKGELTAHLTMKGDLQSFFTLYDNRFGLSYGLDDFEWLNINVLNRMSDALLAAGRMKDAFALVDEFRARNESKHRRAALTTATLNIFLTSALRARDPGMAIAMLRRFRISQPGAVSPDHITYSILFAIAWRKLCYNMLRVVWRYACAAGHAGFMMQNKIRKSLIWSPSESQRMSLSHVWLKWAGKFAVGVHDGLKDMQGARRPSLLQGPEHPTTSSPQLTASESNLVRLDAQPKTEPGTIAHGDRHREITDIIHSDFAQVQNVAPVFPFADLLEQALKKDYEWKEERLGHATAVLEEGKGPEVFAEMMQRGIRVPVRVGDYTKGFRKSEVTHLLFSGRYSERASEE